MMQVRRFLLGLCCLISVAPQLAEATPLPPTMRAQSARGTREAVKVKVRRIDQVQPTSTTAPTPKTALTGKHPIAVVLIETDDARFKNPKIKEEVQRRFFDRAGDSMHTFYKENSYGLYDLHGEVFGPIKVKGRLADYAYGPGLDGGAIHDLISSTLAGVADKIDMSVFDTHDVFGRTAKDGVIDHFAVIFPADRAGTDGYFKPIWPHRGTIDVKSKNKKLKAYYIFSDSVPLGALVHEHGHDIGLPDLYDRDDSSHGAGAWCTMASGSWLGDGHRPGHLSGWAKIKMGWVRPTIVARSQKRVEIPAVETTPLVLKIPVEAVDGSEYFLIENRQRIGWDAELPDEGLLVWHIDDAVKHNDEETHKLVDVVEPSTVQDLDAMYRDRAPDHLDTYRAGKKTRFADETRPSSRSHAGKSTGILIDDISASAGVMVADFEVPTLTVPEGEPTTLVNDNYQYGAFGYVPLPKGSEELMAFEATEGAFDVTTVEALVVAPPGSGHRLQLNFYDDGGGKPGKLKKSQVVETRLGDDSYMWMKARLDAPLRLKGKAKVWLGVQHETDQIGVAYNPESVSKSARFRMKGDKNLRETFPLRDGPMPVPDFIARLVGYGYIGVKEPAVPPQADESDQLVRRMQEADAMLDAKKWAEAKAQYETVLQKMEDDGDRYATWIPVLHNNLGVAAYQAKEYDAAIDYFSRSLKRVQKLGDVRAESDILENIGETHFHAGRLEEAETFCKRSMELNADREDRLLENKYWLGRIAIGRGDAAEARGYFDDAEELAMTIHTKEADLQKRWQARIARARAGKAKGEDPVEGESRMVAELAEERAEEKAPDEPDAPRDPLFDLEGLGVSDLFKP